MIITGLGCMSRRLLIFASPSVTADESMVILSGCGCLLLLSVEAVVAAVEDGSAAWGRLLFLFLDFLPDLLLSSAAKVTERERV